ncbi:MAG: SET domain-containing protein-lysine N-methyltransferase [Chitinophagales bacterium]|nr:SET domain-containing protein-lysine N-methyltransferase [Chitinophagales bacterium]
MKGIRLVVKRSSLPGAGKGLFTKSLIPAGTRIVEYKGRITTWKEVKTSEVENNYIFYVNRNHVINAEPYKKALGRYANDARGLKKIKGVRNNSIYAIDKDKVFIEATRDIFPGEEIFVDYGKDYWDTMRENMKIEKTGE